MKQLIAVSPILFESTNFEPGDELPTHNAGLVDIWTGNGGGGMEGHGGTQKAGSESQADDRPRRASR